MFLLVARFCIVLTAGAEERLPPLKGSSNIARQMSPIPCCTPFKGQGRVW
jgi:hypothetical protein